ncbi:aminoglycoside phosphotransferase family protein [Saccharopolyspora endophytica]|nr:aminoglycoside phosphotransferase family protein [Saccharopolyspora endophytica]
MGRDDVSRQRQVGAAASRVLDQRVEVIGRLGRGRAHQSWMAHTESYGTVVVKTGLQRPETHVVGRLAEHRRVHTAGIAVPEMLGWSTTTLEMSSRLVAVATFLPGTDAEDWHASVVEGDGAMQSVLRGVGEELARLHRLDTPGFSEHPHADQPVTSSWAELVATRVENLQHTDKPVFRAVDRRVFDAACALVTEQAEAVSSVVSPSVVHGDVYLPNVLVERGCFAALMDLEHLRWLDPVMDFVKPAMWVCEGQPDWAASFVAGYWSVAGCPEQFGERLSVATGLELLTGVLFWARVGEAGMRADYWRRLERWVSSDGADHACASWESSMSEQS